MGEVLIRALGLTQSFIISRERIGNFYFIPVNGAMQRLVSGRWAVPAGGRWWAEPGVAWRGWGAPRAGLPQSLAPRRETPCAHFAEPGARTERVSRSEDVSDCELF